MSHPKVSEARFPDAVSLHAFALGMRLRLGDERRPCVARSIAALADAHLATGDLDVAVKGFQEAIGLQVRPCVAPVRPLSGPCQAPVRPLSGPCLAPVRPLSGPCLAPVRPLSGPCLAPVRPLSGPCQAPVRPLSGP